MFASGVGWRPIGSKRPKGGVVVPLPYLGEGMPSEEGGSILGIRSFLRVFFRCFCIRYGRTDIDLTCVYGSILAAGEFR